MPDDKTIEAQHLANLNRLEDQVKKIYESAIHEVAINYSQIDWNGQTFELKDYPQLSNRINNQVKTLHAKIYTTAVNGIKASWNFSNLKNNVLVDKRLAGKTPNKKARSILYDPNRPALDQFLKRKDQGLNLSAKVWGTLDNYHTELETALGVGISEGRSAAEMASDLKRYLNEPDRLFRKVRQDDGTLKLSKAARNYHPGQGVYRSSYQNALRLTATETNMAYRTADWERWQTLPFVKGIEIHLSKNHPEFDICDALKGNYPKTFLFRGWHPRCLCYQTAIQISDVEYDKLEDAILAGTARPTASMIKAPPSNFTKYLTKNRDRIEGWKSTPYWMKDNPQFTKS
jgi:hypothetical protein